MSLRQKNLLICRYTAEGTLIYVNEAYCRYFQKQPEELIGKNFFEFIPPAFHNTVRKYVSGLMPERPAGTMEHTVILANGDIGWQQWQNTVILDQSGRLIYEAVGQDITERKRREQALQFENIELEKIIHERTAQLVEANIELRARELQLKRIQDNMRDLIIQTDEHGIINYASPSHVFVLGLKPCQIEGASVGSLIHTDDVERIKTAFYKLITEAYPAPVECRVKHSNDSYIWIEAIGKPIFDENNKCIGAVIASRSIEQRKQLDAVMQRTREKLASLEKTVTLGVMAAEIAYKINQPLNSLKVEADTILYCNKTSKPLAYNLMMNSIQKISNQASRIGSIIRCLQLLSKNENIIDSACDLNHAIKKICELYKVQLEDDCIEVKLCLASELPRVLAGHVGLEMVIANLLKNAIHACKPREGSRIIYFKTHIRRGRVILDIVDNGVGISKEVGYTLFDPFVDAKHSIKGMGIGLAIVKELMNLYSGEIKLLRHFKAGTAFRLNFNIVEEKTSENTVS